MDPESGLGLTVIFFLGSVFSPRYRAARLRGPSDPLDFPAVNVALYRPGVGRWVLTEYGRDDAIEGAESLRIGPNAWVKDGDDWVLHLNERSAPLRRPLVGEIRVRPVLDPLPIRALDTGANHHWWLVAPVALAEVNLQAPRLRFTGIAYHDRNTGTRPLEHDFLGWHWGRMSTSEAMSVTYDVTERDGTQRPWAMHVNRYGATPIDPKATVSLPKGSWGVQPVGRADTSTSLAVVRSLEDTPFYTRAHTVGTVGGLQGEGVSESLDLTRFEKSWVQALLPFRIRRAG